MTGTRIGRQELMGELLDDVHGALWNRDMIEPHRIRLIDRGSLTRVVVAVDPATTSGAGSDETGVVVCGIGGDGQGYVLDDLTCRLPPDGWARRVAQAFESGKPTGLSASATRGASSSRPSCVP